jgi:protein-tyrosine phosphatase
MVCLGNICRSPVAQACMEHALFERFGEGHHWMVDSAGTSDQHRGAHPDLRSQASALRHGMDISAQCSRPLELADFDRFDHILVMDESNLRNALLLSPSGGDKVSLALEASFPGEGREVPDPYYGGELGFELVVQLLQQACRDWIALWEREERSI